MSRFPGDLLAVARSLASLQGVRPDVGDDAGARLVLEARSATLSLVARLVADVTYGSGHRQPWREVPRNRVQGTEKDRWRYNPGHIETMPAALTLLARVPDAPVQSLTLLAHVESGLGRSGGDVPARPTDLASQVPKTNYEGLWQRVLSAAIVARASWSDFAPATAAGEWTLAADAASIAAAVSTLDRSLLPVLGRTLTDPQARDDVAMSVSGAHLRTASLRVLDLALTGPLPSLDADAWYSRRGPVPVHSPYSLIDAQSRLPQLLGESGPLPPADIVAVATAQALAHQFAAATLGGAGSERGREMSAIAQQLAEVSPASTRQLHTLVGISPADTDDAVRVQALEITRYLLAARTTPIAGAERVADALVDLAPPVIQAATAVATRELREGNWLVTYGPRPDLYAQRYPFRDLKIGMHDHERKVELPRLVVALNRAGELAGPDSKLSLRAPATVSEIPQPFAVLDDLAREEPDSNRPDLLTDVDEAHAVKSPTSVESRERLKGIRQRLETARQELRIEGAMPPPPERGQRYDPPQPQRGPQL